MQNVDIAKGRLLRNVGSNILVVIVNTLSGIWLTRYLIEQLGLAVYGMVPLVVVIVSYFNPVTQAISSTVGRFIGVHLGKGDNEGSNIYFSTAFFTLLALCGLILLPAIAITIFLPKLFQIPAGYEVEACWLFAFVASFSIISSVNTPFLAVLLVKHRFYLSSFVNVGAKLFQIGIIVVCFTLLAVSVKYVGMSYFGMALFTIVCSVPIARYLAPQLHIQRGLFKWFALCKMGVMGAWTMINQVGAKLYLSIDMVVINLFLGSAEVGRYYPFVLLAHLLDLLGSAVSHVFTPIAYEYVSQSKMDELTRQTKRSIKFLALIMSLPAGLLCGLSVPVLTRWLGPSFAAFSLLAWLLIGPRIITFVIRPVFAVNQGLNKVKVPSIVTVIGGLTNLAVSILLVRYTNLGLYGVALATAVCLTGKNLLFTPIYGAIILGSSKKTFFSGIMISLLLFGTVSLTGLTMSRIYDLATIPRLAGSSLLISFVYSLVCYWLVLNKEDRVFLWSLVRKSEVGL